MVAEKNYLAVSLAFEEGNDRLTFSEAGEFTSIAVPGV